MSTTPTAQPTIEIVPVGDISPDILQELPQVLEERFPGRTVKIAPQINRTRRKKPIMPESNQPNQQPSSTEKASVRVIKPHQFDSNTPQTPGMERVAAISKASAGSQSLWGGITIVAPNTSSGIHHHGETETIIYVVSGHGKIRWGDHMEFEQEVEPGDFIYVPPFAPHQEINPSPDTPSEWVIVRNSQEPIVVNLEYPEG